ncbi:MAG: hypothetical protein HY711_01215 [Candidatus Melainabacteria bacterium]|nr:hypothetical protein [Candidatus Melainabacteria bacterium]
MTALIVIMAVTCTVFGCYQVLRQLRCIAKTEYGLVGTMLGAIIMVVVSISEFLASIKEPSDEPMVAADALHDSPENNVAAKVDMLQPEPLQMATNQQIRLVVFNKHLGKHKSTVRLRLVTGTARHTLDT